MKRLLFALLVIMVGSTPAVATWPCCGSAPVITGAPVLTGMPAASYQPVVVYRSAVVYEPSVVYWPTVVTTPPPRPVRYHYGPVKRVESYLAPIGPSVFPSPVGSSLPVSAPAAGAYVPPSHAPQTFVP
ncbi:MAG TPA: hypothetical protein EYH34_17240 [Planctomycetes bacterium]|nr:hypothetical protein [Planctomycetota bacterium]